MTIADLFVNLGVKGAAGAGNALNGIKKGLGEVGESSLAAKAGIAAVVIGLERLTGFASQIGMDLNKFAITTGLSTDQLQKWQYAAMRFDVSGEEMAGTIKGVQNAMSDMLMGKGAPESLGLLADKVGFDPKRARDTFYVMGKIQEFSKSQPPDIANNLLKSFGISENVFQMLKASNLEIDKIAKKDIITQKEIAQLTNINKAWKDFWFSLKTMGIKLVAREGMFAVTELANSFKLLMDGGKYLLDLVEKFKVLKVIAVAVALAIGYAFAPITTVIVGLLLLMSDIQKYKEGKDSVLGSVFGSAKGTDPEKSLRGGGGFMLGPEAKGADKFKSGNTQSGEFWGNVWGKVKAGFSGGDAHEKSMAESMSAKHPEAGQGDQGAGVTPPTVTVHNYGVEHPKETGQETQKGINNAFRQISAQAGGR